MVCVGREIKRPSSSSCLLTSPRIIQFIFLLQPGLENSRDGVSATSQLQTEVCLLAASPYQ